MAKGIRDKESEPKEPVLAFLLRYSGRPKRVNTETTETEISVGLTETKPKIPKRNLAYIFGEFI